MKKKNLFKSLTPIIAILISVLIVVAIAKAGSLTPSNDPAATSYTLTDIYNRVNTNATAIEADHSFTPAGSPGDTLKTLIQIYDKIPTINSSKLLDDTTYLGVTGSIADCASEGLQACYVTGSYYAVRDWSLQKNRIWDDWKGSAVSTDQGLLYAYNNNLDQNEEEATWQSYTDANLNGALVASGAVKKDTRTGLYWSDCYSSVSGDETCETRTNIFILNGIIGDSDDGLDAEGGQAVDFCEALSLDADGDTTDETDWYLPSQKELMQVYIDGSPNILPQSDHGYWSSTEVSSDSSLAWYLYLHGGSTGGNPKSGAIYVRCVCRD